MAKKWKTYDVRLVNNEKGSLKYTSRTTHATSKIFDKIMQLFMKLSQF